MKGRTAAANQLHSLIDTAPDPVRAQLRALTFKNKVGVAAAWRPTITATPDGASRYAVASVARRWRVLALEIAELDRRIKTILDDIAAPLIAVHGVGYDTAGQLLVTAGVNPETAGPRTLLRRALRRLPGPGLLRQDRPAPTQPRRRPPRQLRAMAHRHRAHELTPTHQALHRPPHRRRTHQTRDHPLPQALHRPRTLPPHQQRDHTRRRSNRCLTPRGASRRGWSTVPSS